MNKTARFTDRLREICRERDHVVIRRLLDLVDALNRKLRARFYLLQRIARNRAHLGVNLADSDFHVEPFLKLVLLRPERAHFGQCVTIDHYLFTEARWNLQSNAPVATAHSLLLM